MKKTRYVILGLLQEEDLSGYEIKRIIDVRMSFFWQESYGQIYPELNRLLEEGLISTADIPKTEKSKREKTKYRITDAGTQILKSWMEHENEKDSSRSEFLLKLYLSTKQNKNEMRQHVVRFQEESEQRLQLFQLFQSQLTRDINVHKNHRQILMVLDLGVRQAQLYIQWCQDTLNKLEENYE